MRAHKIECGCRETDSRYTSLCVAHYTEAVAHRESLRAQGYPMPEGTTGLPPAPELEWLEAPHDDSARILPTAIPVS